MGTLYYVTCEDCKITRDLDKFYSAGRKCVETRADALEFAKIIEGDSFRAGLLVSFMAEHKGHRCVFYCEHTLCPLTKEGQVIEDVDIETMMYDYPEDTDFWAKEVEK